MRRARPDRERRPAPLPPGGGGLGGGGLGGGGLGGGGLGGGGMWLKLIETYSRPQDSSVQSLSFKFVIIFNFLSQKRVFLVKKRENTVILAKLNLINFNVFK